MDFFIKNLFSKCERDRIKLRIYSHLLNKSLTENFIFVSLILLVLLLSLASKGLELSPQELLRDNQYILLNQYILMYF